MVKFNFCQLLFRQKNSLKCTQYLLSVISVHAIYGMIDQTTTTTLLFHSNGNFLA
jgi:hypothetical protein